jgi:hypothetical protein
MNILTGIRATGTQNFQTLTEEGVTIDITLRFLPAVQAWVMDLKYQSFSVYGERLIVGLNVFRKYKNILPFGVLVDSLDGGDPFIIDDFTSGRCTLAILNEDEVSQAEGIYSSFDPTLLEPTFIDTINTDIAEQLLTDLGERLIIFANGRE